eukprot:Lithocolla_globosa_v1_NODE_15_length_10543_cov_26.361651.p4 type:complete len:277 gc:universal NODE_15_length_10543_cov_26.361651:9074-8244(-)
MINIKQMYKQKINKIQNIPLPNNTSGLPPKKILGYDMFNELYSNIFLCAKKKSGKSSTIYNILRECADKETTVVVFCSTCERDKAWITIRQFLEKKKIMYQFYQSIKEDGINHLKELLDQVKLAEEETDESDDEPEPEILLLNTNKISVRVKKKKPKKISPKYIIIFDDISAELKDPNVSQLLKQNRHYKSKVIISSQWLNDIPPQARRQIEYYILFGGMNDQKLDELYQNADLDVTLDEFHHLYKDATKQKYHFLYVDTNGEYRKDFSERYLIPK